MERLSSKPTLLRGSASKSHTALIVYTLVVLCNYSGARNLSLMLIYGYFLSMFSCSHGFSKEPDSASRKPARSCHSKIISSLQNYLEIDRQQKILGQSLMFKAHSLLCLYKMFDLARRSSTVLSPRKEPEMSQSQNVDCLTKGGKLLTNCVDMLGGDIRAWLDRDCARVHDCFISIVWEWKHSHCIQAIDPSLPSKGAVTSLDRSLILARLALQDEI